MQNIYVPSLRYKDYTLARDILSNIEGAYVYVCKFFSPIKNFLFNNACTCRTLCY